MQEIPAGPAVTNAPAPEAKAPAVPVTKAEANSSVTPAKEAGKKTGPEVLENTGNKIDTDADVKEAVQNLINDIESVGGGDSDILTDLATKGDAAKNLELSGQRTREKAESAPTEGEGALTNEQKMQQLAIGYDEEIGGLQIKLDRTKNQKERQVISDKIKTLQQEKKDKTGIEKNQFNGLAEILKLDEHSIKFIDDHIKNGTPIVAVEKILEQAVVDKNVRQAVITKLKESGQFDDQIEAFEKSLNRKAKVKGTEKVAKMAGIGSLIGMILMMYSGLKKEKPGAG